MAKAQQRMTMGIKTRLSRMMEDVYLFFRAVEGMILYPWFRGFAFFVFLRGGGVGLGRMWLFGGKVGGSLWESLRDSE